MPVDVSVIIVSYNAREVLERSLASVTERAPDGLDVEVIVVDNASSDDSVAWVRAHHPDVILIESGGNPGFAAANNLGIARARGRYLLLLNSDAFLVEDALGQMVRHADEHPQVGVVGPRLLNEDGSLQRSARGFATVWRLATEYLYLRKLGPRTRALNSFYMGWFDHDRQMDVEWLKGACLLVRTAAVDEVGPMEESYFMFSEEADWCRRFWRAGWHVRFLPSARVTHLGGASTSKEWQRMYDAQVVSHVRYLALNTSPRAAARARRLLSWSLALRALGYRALSLLGSRHERVQRATVYAGARRALRRIDIPALVAERSVQQR